MWKMILLACLLVVPVYGQDDDTVELFDGETLDGWRVVNGTATYRVEEGCIVGTNDPDSPRNTFLRTEETYSDFILEFDVKFDQIGNSGVQFRSRQREAGDGAPDGRVYGYQAEIDSDRNRRFSGGIYDEGRRGWLDNPDGDDDARDAFDYDGWNHYRIVAEGRHLRTWVNGVPVADYLDESESDFTPEGFIALQVHAGGPSQIRWKNLQLTPIGD